MVFLLLFPTEMLFPDSDSKFFSSFSKRLNALRRAEQFCDVCLTVDGQNYVAHRAVLAASSQYFNALFTTSMKEKDSTAIKLAIPSSIAEELLTFLYTGDTILCKENVKQLLLAADYLMLEELKQQCVKFLALELSPSTCPQIYHLAVKYNCQELAKKAESYILKNFSLMKEQFEFMYMDVHQLGDVISSDELVVGGEDEVFEAIVTWVNYDANQRERYFDDLFKRVRLWSLTVDYVENLITTNAYVNRSNFSKSAVLERLQSTTAPTNPIMMRKCLQVKDLAIVCLGGRTEGKAVNSVNAYSPHQNQLVQFQDLLTEKEDHLVAVWNNNLYVIGGMKTPNAIECFHHGTQRWTTVAQLPEKAISSAGVCMDGKIYVIGGNNGFASVSTVLCYDISSTTVEILPPLKVPREALCAVVVNQEIYAIGGSTGNTTFRSVEKLDPSNGNAWQPVSSMLHDRKNACAEALGSGRILVMGGYSGNSPTALITCEVYNSVYDTWCEVSSLTSPRAAAASARVGDKIFVLGGRSDRISSDTMEYYDEDDNEWCLIERRLPYPVAWLQCGVVSLTTSLATK